MTLEDIRRIDLDGMYDLVKAFPNHWREGKEIADAASLNVDMASCRHVVVVGMGGSAIAGDIVRCFAQDQAPVPISVIRNYTMPAFVNEHSLVVVSSFSGNTEETLTAFEQALERGSQIVCIASGGQVAELAAKNNLSFVKIPGGMPPRAALGYSLSVLFVIAQRLGLVQLSASDWEESFEVLDGQTEQYADSESDHKARQIAEALTERFPFVYSSAGIMEAVNVRWRGQMQENSKKLACGNVYPELNHNEIMGWESANGVTIHGRLGVVVLRDAEDHDRVQHRMDVTRNLLSARAGYWGEVTSEGQSRLARLVSLINLGDWVSLYLAYLRQVDPTPIGLIDTLKRELAKV